MNAASPTGGSAGRAGKGVVRLIHSQMQQRARLKSLESFIACPRGVLVATDVAARGLDLPKIDFVIHYDIARSAQVRPGRCCVLGTAGLFPLPSCR